MLRRSTWIVLGIFAVLVMGAILWQRYGKTEEPVAPAPTVAVTELVFDLGNLVISRYSISGKDGAAITFERDPASNVWVVENQPAELADSTTIETGAANLAFLSGETKLITQPPLDSMGLEQPTYTITLFLNNGEQAVLHVGDQTPTGTGYYVGVDNSPAVVVAKLELDPIINLLTTPPLAATYTPAVTMTTISTSTATKTATNTPGATSEPVMTITSTP